MAKFRCYLQPKMAAPPAVYLGRIKKIAKEKESNRYAIAMHSLCNRYLPKIAMLLGVAPSTIVFFALVYPLVIHMLYMLLICY